MVTTIVLVLCIIGIIFAFAILNDLMKDANWMRKDLNDFYSSFRNHASSFDDCVQCGTVYRVSKLLNHPAAIGRFCEECFKGVALEQAKKEACGKPIPVEKEKKEKRTKVEVKKTVKAKK